MSSDRFTPTIGLDSGLHEYGLAPAFNPTVRTPISTPRNSNEDFADMVDANTQTDPGLFSESTTPDSMDTHISLVSPSSSDRTALLPSPTVHLCARSITFAARRPDRRYIATFGTEIEQLAHSDTVGLQHQMLLGRLETIAEQEARHLEGLCSDNGALRSHLGDIQLSLHSSQADAQPERRGGTPHDGNGSLPSVTQDGSHTNQDGYQHRDAARADFGRGTDLQTFPQTSHRNSECRGKSAQGCQCCVMS